MVAFDASVLSLAIYEDAGVPVDFETGTRIHRAAERVEALIKRLSDDNETIMLPAPALAEALVSVADDLQAYLTELENQAIFKIVPFGTREATELAIRTHAAIVRGDKRDGDTDSPWQKVKFDRQIVAIAAAEGVAMVYSTDRHIHKHCKVWGVNVMNISKLPLSTTEAEPQTELFKEDAGLG